MNLREEEEDEECTKDDQAQYKPASPGIPGAVSADCSAIGVDIAATSHCVSVVCVISR